MASDQKGDQPRGACVPPRIGFATELNPNRREAWSGTNRAMLAALEATSAGVRVLPPILEGTTVLLNRVGKVAKRFAGVNLMPNRHPRVAALKARVLAREARAAGVDVLFAPASSALIAAMPPGLPIAYASDATLRLLIGYYPGYTGLPPAVERRAVALEAAAMRQADLLVYPSRWAARSAVEDYGIDPARVMVQPFGANLPDPPPRAEALAPRPPGPLRLLFCGVDWRRKGGPVALGAVRALRERGVPAELLILGCAPPAGEALPPGVEVIPFLDKAVPAERVRFRRAFAEADVLLLPTEAECFGIVMCEAAASKPCAAPPATTSRRASTGPPGRRRCCRAWRRWRGGMGPLRPDGWRKLSPTRRGAGTSPGHPDGGCELFHFIVPVRHPSTVTRLDEQRTRIEALLASMAAQTDPRFLCHVVVNPEQALPPLPPFARRVDLDIPPSARLAAAQSRDEVYDAIQLDKGARVAAAVRDVAPDDLVMVADDDDLVARRLVAFALRRHAREGATTLWVVDKGYGWDGGAKAWPINNFHRTCGTSLIVPAHRYRFRPGREAQDPEAALDDLRELGSHRRIVDTEVAAGRPVAPVPFRAAIYRLGQANTSRDLLEKAGWSPPEHRGSKAPLHRRALRWATRRLGLSRPDLAGVAVHLPDRPVPLASLRADFAGLPG